MSAYDYNDEMYHFGCLGASHLRSTCHSECPNFQSPEKRDRFNAPDPFELLSPLDLERIALPDEPTDLEDEMDSDDPHERDDDSGSRYFVKGKGEVTIEKVKMLKLVYAELALSALGARKAKKKK